jgi:hypothetical protein
MPVGVVVPSVDRTNDLNTCLNALLAQDIEEEVTIIVVATAADTETIDLVRTFPSVRLVTVTARDVVVSLSAGLEVARALNLPYVAFTDDDAEAPNQWLRTAISLLENDAHIAAVGGPDRQDHSPPRQVAAVGHINWWTGRVTGNHHVAWETSSTTEVLKGVNMIWRTSDIELPRLDRLQYSGTGAVPHYELYMACVAARRGHRLVFCKDAWVRHAASPRPIERFTDTFSECYNRLVALAQDCSPVRSYTQVAYSLVVGFRAEPGLARAAVALIRGEPRPIVRMLATWRAAISALRVIRLSAAKANKKPQDQP